MKKIFTFLIFLFGINNILNAQDTLSTQKSRFSLELVAEPGLSFSEIEGSVLEPYLTTDIPLAFGGNFGVGASCYFNNKMGIGLNILFAYKVNKSSSTQCIMNEIRTWEDYSKTQYLKIPIDYKFFLCKEKKISLLLSAGIYFSTLLSYVRNGNYSYFFDDGSYTTGNSITSNYSTVYNTTAHNALKDTTYISITKYQGELIRPFDFGCQFKAGFLYSVSSKIQIPILLSYEMGLFNILNNDSWYHVNYGNSSSIWRVFTWGEQKNYNSLISIHLGLIYKI